jgi:hypothetical protein
MRTIHITVDPQGNVKLQTRGYAGRACLDASRELEQVLGERVSETMTNEYFQQTEERQRHQEHQQ